MRLHCPEVAVVETVKAAPGNEAVAHIPNFSSLPLKLVSLLVC